MRIDVVCDIETLGKGQSPPVFQIAACAFDIKTGELKYSYNQKADIAQMTNIEGDTLKWWLQTNRELLSNLVGAGSVRECVHPTECDLITRFVLFLNNLKDQYDEIYFWGNGILFDNRIISQKCRDYNLVYPIHYRNDRDIRTLLELACIKTGKTREEFEGERQSVAHEALNDALFEKDVICKAYKAVIDDN